MFAVLSLSGQDLVWNKGIISKKLDIQTKTTSLLNDIIKETDTENVCGIIFAVILKFPQSVKYTFSCSFLFKKCQCAYDTRAKHRVSMIEIKAKQ